MKFNLLNILNLLLVLLIVSCSNKVEDVNDNQDKSMFEIGTITVQGTQVYAQNEQWPDLKNKMVVTMSSCLQDSVYTEQIVGADFQIMSKTTNMTDTTGVSGCLYWNEVIDFNYLSKEDYFVLSGKIIGKGKFKGSQNYSIIVNPWQNKALAMRKKADLKFLELKNPSKMLNSFDNSLHIENIEYTITSKHFTKDNSNLSININFSPEFKRLSQDSTLVKSFFTQGSFNIKYYLIEKDMHAGSRKVLATSYRHNVKLQSSRFIDKLKLKIEDAVSANSILELGVELEGSNAPFGLGIIKGLIQIEQLSGADTSRLSEVSLLDMSSLHLKRSFRNTDYLKDMGIILDEISFERGTTTNNGGLNTVNTNINVCVADPLLRRIIQDHPIRVQMISIESDKIVFDETKNTNIRSGCIEIQPRLNYSDLDSRSWKEYMIRVSSSDSPFIDVVKERKVFINPWIENNSFGIDSRDGVPPVSQDNSRPSFYIKDFSYKKIDPLKKSFVLKQDLSFTFDMAYTFRITPKIKVEQNFEKSQKYGDVPNGKYKLRGVILVPKTEVDYANEQVTLNNYFPLSGFESEVIVEDGVIETQVNFPLNVNSLMFITSRSTILLELSALGNDYDVQPGLSLRMFRGRVKEDKSEIVKSTDMFQVQKSINVEQKITDLLGEVNKMMTIDNSLGDYNPDSFVKHLNDIDESVMTADYNRRKKTWDFYERKIHTMKLNNKDRFLKSKGSQLSRQELNKLIRDPQNASDKLVKELCHIYFEQNEVVTMDPSMIALAAGAAGPAAVMMSMKPITIVKNPLYDKCIKDPRKYINLRKYQHSTRVSSAPESVVLQADEVRFSNAKFTSKGQQYHEMVGDRVSNYTYRNVEAYTMAQAYASGPMPMIPFAKYEVGAGVRAGVGSGKRTDIYITSQNSEILSYLDRDIVDSWVKFRVDTFDLSFNAKVKSCLLISTNTYMVDFIKEDNFFRDDILEPRPVRSNRRYYVCLDDEIDVVASEQWYVMAIDSMGNISSNEQQQGQVVSVIKGRETYAAFKNESFMENIELLLFSEDLNGNESYYENYKRKVRSELTKDNQYQFGSKYPGLLD